MRLIDADALKRRAQKIATESWKMRLTANVETVLNQFIDWIDQADTVETFSYAHENDWVPVSERLPEDEGWYLVTDDSGGVRWLEVEHYDPEFGLKPFCTIQNPVAWMDLPEPWKDDKE